MHQPLLILALGDSVIPVFVFVVQVFAALTDLVVAASFEGRIPCKRLDQIQPRILQLTPLANALIKMRNFLF